jgi:hypothetical protein
MLVAADEPQKNSDELLAPVMITAGGQPIDVEIGHAAPFVGDFDRDGKIDLLVGQFGGGKLRIYKNTGSNEKPTFDKFDWFMAGAELGVVPAG